MRDYVSLFQMAVVVIFIVDCSGFPDTVKRWLGRWLGRNVSSLRPLDCSLCMVWWSCLVYGCCLDGMSVGMLAYIATLSLLAYPLSELMNLVRDMLLRFCRAISDFLKL